MHRSVLLVVVALLLSVATIGTSGAMLADSTAAAVAQDDTTGFGANAAQEFDSDSTTFTITVYANGTARWTFTYERILSTTADEEEFRTYAEEFETEETDLYNRFTEQASALTDTGAEETDREMEATDFQRSAEIDHRPNAMGVVEMSFTWANFAPVDDGAVTVGDVFDGGLYIGSGQTLVIETGDDLVFQSVDPDPTHPDDPSENTDFVRWDGELEFLDERPYARLVPADQLQTGDDDGGSGSDPDDGGEGEGSDGSLWLVGAGLLLLVGTGAVVAWRRYDRGEAPVDAVSTDGTASAEGPSQSADTGSSVPDEELLTDEDRVVSLIQQNGGRMKQVDIVEATGWSKSKVSMLLSDMDEDGTISKLRVGRENIISLEGFEPEATKSPFDE